MSLKLPPPPIQEQDFNYNWRQWFLKVKENLTGLSNLSWSLINFTGSKISDILDRKHNDLQSIQGGTSNEYYHLTSAQYTNITTANPVYTSVVASDSITTNQATVNGTTYTGQLVSWNNDGTKVGLGTGTASATATAGAVIFGGRARGTVASPTIVSNGDTLRRDYAVGWDGTDFAMGGYTEFKVDNTPGSNDMPTYWSVNLSADGSQTPAERFGVDNTGKIHLPNSPTASTATTTHKLAITLNGTTYYLLLSNV